MAKHKSKKIISASSPDEMQKSLLPGTKEYVARQSMKKLQEAYDAADAVPSEPVVPVAVKQNKEPVQDMAHDVAVRKFRRKMSKERKVKMAVDIAKDGIGKSIPEHNVLNLPGIKSMDDELYDDGVSEKSFVHDVLRDYKSELDSLVSQDNNHDGDIDEDDITPGMRRMRKYM